MSRYITKRLFRSLLTIFVSITLTFFIIRLMPSNPVDLMIDPHMTESMKEQLMEVYGLNQSLFMQYLIFLKGILMGDFGLSFATRQPVASMIMQKLPWTLLLIAVVMLLIVIVGVPLGVWAARRRGQMTDRIISTCVTLMISVFIPFLAFLLLFIFAYKLNWLPTGGAYTPPKMTGWPYFIDVLKHAILPAVALSISNLANVVLYTRNSMIDTLHEDYIRTAYSKGISTRGAIRVHALKNAMIPTVTVIGMQVGVMVGGAVMTETIFSWPGIGRMMFDAISALDYPVLQGGFLLLSFSVILMNFLTDLVIAWLDPRVKLGGA